MASVVLIPLRYEFGAWPIHINMKILRNKKHFTF
ncbi:hypothetical protein DFO55_12839 [Grimontella sp. AG753]|nr:hypothetical protein DFO55_12839 [Grimontella sp. AG753]